MDDENTAQGPLSIMDGVEKLKQSRERSLEKPETQEVEEEPQETEAENQADAEMEAEAFTETETPEVEEDQPEADVEEEANVEGNDLYEVEGVEFTLSQLKEWQKGGLLQSDYTKKTQALSEEKAEFATERQRFESEKTQAQQAIQQQHAQLQDALASFAIEQDPEPLVKDFANWDDFRAAKAEWDTRSQKRQEAQHLYQALQGEEKQERLGRELSTLFAKKPEWRDQKVYVETMGGLEKIAGVYGYSPEEFALIDDHRLFLALDDLRALRATADTRKAKEMAAEKRVVKAAKRLTPAAKQKPATAAQKKVREAKSQFKKTGSYRDAAKVLGAARRAG